MVKCIVWDLDNTVWDGTLDANDNVELNLDIKKYIEDAFEKGIVLVIASKNDYMQAYSKIQAFEMEKYFYKFYISFDDKYKSIKNLAEELNISIEHILFIDDSDIELSEALYYLPTLQILNVKDINKLDEYINETIQLTDEARNRNKIYRILEERKTQERQMSRQEFLQYCDIKINISKATEKDYNRIVELLSRTNQMNLNNKLLNNKELENIEAKDEWTIYVVRMKDVFADYGIVGTVIIQEDEKLVRIEYLAISCKVEGRNIGKHVIEYIKEQAKLKEKNIIAEYIYNLKNDKLKALLILNGFVLDTNNFFLLDLKAPSIKDDLNQKLNPDFLNKVKQIVDDIGKKDYDKNFSVKHDFDSLMFIRLVVTIEKNFGISIDLSNIDINKFDTIIKITKFLVGKQK